MQSAWITTSSRTTTVSKRVSFNVTRLLPLLTEISSTDFSTYHQITPVCWAITTSCLYPPVHHNICESWGMQSVLLWVFSLEHIACTQAVCTRGISQVMRLTRCKPGSMSQEREGGWKWSLIHAKTKWHNDEINKNTAASLKPCGKRQQSPTCFHFVLARTGTMLFWCTQANVLKLLYSTGCSLGGSSARGPFALQAGTSRPGCKRHSSDMRAPIHIQTESKLLLSCSCQTGMHIVSSFSSERILLCI